MKTLCINAICAGLIALVTFGAGCQVDAPANSHAELDSLRPKLVVWRKGTDDFVVRCGIINSGIRSVLVKERPEIRWEFVGSADKDGMPLAYANSRRSFTFPDGKKFEVVSPIVLSGKIMDKAGMAHDDRHDLSRIASEDLPLRLGKDEFYRLEGIWTITAEISLIHYERSTGDCAIESRKAIFVIKTPLKGLDQMLPIGSVRLLDPERWR